MTTPSHGWSFLATDVHQTLFYGKSAEISLSPVMATAPQLYTSQVITENAHASSTCIHTPSFTMLKDASEGSGTETMEGCAKGVDGP